MKHSKGEDPPFNILIFKAIVAHLTEWRYGPDVRWSSGYAKVVLNDKIRLYINYSPPASQVVVWLVKIGEGIKTNPLEIIWKWDIADPQCFDLLHSFLRSLPDRLASVAPEYAITA